MKHCRHPRRNQQESRECEREEMKDWTKQAVDKLFREKGRPAGKPFDVLRIPANDEEAACRAL